jgi:predicted GH43/DUF377 family glycosyl hydrolase
MVLLPDLEIYNLPQPLSALRLPGTQAAVRAYNPSLAWHRETLVMAFRISSMTRCHQRLIDFERYYSGELPPIINALGVAFLDPATMALHGARQLDVTMPRDCPWTLGYEDPRIFSFSDSLYLLVCHRNVRWVFAMSIIELGTDLEPHRILAIETDFDVGMHQKNWNPFVSDNKLLFVSSIAPHRIVAVNLDSGKATLVHDNATGVFCELETENDLRGGAGYVKCADRYVGVCRSALKQESALNTNEYKCVAYAFEASPPFAVTGRSEPFTLGQFDGHRTPIQMATGLAQLNDDLLIAFGEDDCDLKIARVPQERLLAAIR